MVELPNNPSLVNNVLSRLVPRLLQQLENVCYCYNYACIFISNNSLETRTHYYIFNTTSARYAVRSVNRYTRHSKRDLVEIWSICCQVPETNSEDLVDTIATFQTGVQKESNNSHGYVQQMQTIMCGRDFDTYITCVHIQHSNIRIFVTWNIENSDFLSSLC